MQNPPTRFTVKYENAAALYAAQTIVNASSSEVIIDFSSGPISANEEQILPVHTRIALSVEAAQRLSRLLQQATQPSQNGEARMPG